MVCPWFKDGACHSPKLQRPDERVVGNHCKSEMEYKSCSFYVEPEEEDRKNTLLRFTPSKSAKEVAFEERYKPYDPIMALNTEPQSKCPYFKAVRGSNGKWYAICRVLDRVLTITEVKLCTHHWRTCPLYKNAPKLVSE